MEGWNYQRVQAVCSDHGQHEQESSKQIWRGLWSRRPGGHRGGAGGQRELGWCLCVTMVTVCNHGNWGTSASGVVSVTDMLHSVTPHGRSPRGGRTGPTSLKQTPQLCYLKSVSTHARHTDSVGHSERIVDVHTLLWWHPSEPRVTSDGPLIRTCVCASVCVCFVRLTSTLHDCQLLPEWFPGSGLWRQRKDRPRRVESLRMSWYTAAYHTWHTDWHLTKCYLWNAVTAVDATSCDL